jgi:N-acetylglucosamine kinase-like BadF-type ATPase
MADGRVVFEGRGGPGNPLAVGAEILAASFRTALAGCPEPTHVVACVSGAGGGQQREQVAGLLAERFASAVLRVVPDYVAAMRAAPVGTDVVVIAGTGSVVCSTSSSGGQEISGGRGWILGDRGSAARLGQAALEWFCDGSDHDPESAGLVRECMGSAEWRQIAADLNASKNPAALLARAAPVLTQAAERGSGWAVEMLNAEMARLAATTRRHITQYPRSSPGAAVRIALAGGVWRSSAAIASFRTAMAERQPATPLVLVGPIDPIDGAASLAVSMAR